MPTRVKICCIQNIDEMWMAVNAGASAIGLVSQMPSGPGPISDSAIIEIASHTPPPVATFLLTCQTNPRKIIEQQKKMKTNTIQFVDKVDIDAYGEIREALPGISLVQAVHVRNQESVETAMAVAPYVDALLLDSGNPELKVKVLGGTGKTHDWKLSRMIVENVDVPVFLAGGINPGNARRAIETVKPFGIDICTGVRSDDVSRQVRRPAGPDYLDGDKLRELFENIKQE